jgi:uncharacterized protein YcfJ
MKNIASNVLVVGGSAIATGALGAWAGAKLGSRYGFKAGPWGVVAGTVLGALAGAWLKSAGKGDPAAAEIEEDTP